MNFFRKAKMLKIWPWEMAAIPAGWIDKMIFYTEVEQRAGNIKPVEKVIEEEVEAQYGDA
jgi:hypothetical protein